MAKPRKPKTSRVAGAPKAKTSRTPLPKTGTPPAIRRWAHPGEAVPLPAFDPDAPYKAPDTEEARLKRIGAVQTRRSLSIASEQADRAAQATVSGGQLPRRERSIDSAVDVPFRESDKERAKRELDATIAIQSEYDAAVRAREAEYGAMDPKTRKASIGSDYRARVAAQVETSSASPRRRREIIMGRTMRAPTEAERRAPVQVGDFTVADPEYQASAGYYQLDRIREPQSLERTAEKQIADEYEGVKLTPGELKAKTVERLAQLQAKAETGVWAPNFDDPNQYGAPQSVLLGRHRDISFGPRVQAAAQHAMERDAAHAVSQLSTPEGMATHEVDEVEKFKAANTDYRFGQLQDAAWRAEEIRSGRMTPAEASMSEPDRSTVTHTQMAYMLASRFGPEVPAEARDFTIATQQRMEIVVVPDPDDPTGKRKLHLRFPILNDEPDEDGTYSVRPDTEAIATKYAGDTKQKGGLHQIRMKVKGPQITFQRMQQAQEHAAGEMITRQRMQKVFDAMVRDYQHYKGRALRKRIEEVTGTRNAPMDRHRIWWLMVEYGFKLPTWSKVHLPVGGLAAWAHRKLKPIIPPR